MVSLGSSGAPIIFLHGFSLDYRMWQPQVEFFSSATDVETAKGDLAAKGFRPTNQTSEPQGFRPTRPFDPSTSSGQAKLRVTGGYRVITPDAIGHGQSDTPATGYSRAHRVQDLAGLVDNLKIERFHLVGLSMGGSTALGYALAHQERLESLSLVSTGAAGYRISRRFDRLDHIARRNSVAIAKAEWIRWCRAGYRGERQELGRQLEEIMNDYSGAVWQDPMRGQYPEEDDLSRVAQITVPTAIFAGASDRVFAVLAEKLHERIEGSQLKIYENTAHMLNLEQPERCNADLKVFLEGVARS